MAGKIQLPMREEDVGATLISILSEGLYTNPLHAIREYVQNSIDAGAREVIIKMTGNTVIIKDDGSGMNLEELRQARQVGISKKDYAQFVGFRGIGIYSGFGLCNRLVIVTQKEGESNQYALTFDFMRMREQIAEERKDRSKTTPLTELISQHTWFEERPGDPTRHYTIVQLFDIGHPHLDRLYDVEALRKYLLCNVPVDFHEDFPYREEIVRELSRLPGYRASQIRIQADGREDVLVVKPPIPNLAPPKTGYLTHNGKAIAFYWWCRHTRPEKIPDEYRDYRGLVFKLKGFTIGDNSMVIRQRFFRRGSGTLHEWVTGEIYVLDDEIVPNAERDDFQAGQAREILMNEVRKFWEEVEKEVDRWRAETKARNDVKAAREKIQIVQERIDAGKISTEDCWNLLEILQEAEYSIDKQIKALPYSERGEAQALKKQAGQLKERIQRQIESPGRSTEKHRKRGAPLTQPPIQTSPIQIPLISPAAGMSLLQTIQEAGWDIPAECERFLTIIDEALKEFLSQEDYRRILRYIGEKIEEA